MKICAITAEFNPFHNGHKYILDEARRGFDAVVVIMSGNFVQRGGAAVYDKHTRAEIALHFGADLVIELPIIYAVSPAETFARGAVETIGAIGCVDAICFGSECGNIGNLKKIAQVIGGESESFKQTLRDELQKGCSFPAARQKAVEAELKRKAPEIKESNNILAIEYLRALDAVGSKIEAKTVKINANNIGASEIRKKLQIGEDVSSFVPYNESYPCIFDKDFEDLLLYRVKTATQESLIKYADHDGELISRILKNRHKDSLEEVLEAVKCRHFTRSRVRRFLFNMLIENTQNDYIAPQYIRPLAYNETGKKILAMAKKTAKLPIASRISTIKDSPIFEYERRADAVYDQIAKKKSSV